MLFSESERTSLISLLETYSEAKSSRFPLDEKQRLISSSLQKLSNLSPFTHFTKQEYEIMLQATEYMFNAGEKVGIMLNDELYDACVKIADIYNRIYLKD